MILWHGELPATTQKSYYKKANIYYDSAEDCFLLQSYNTIMCKVKGDMIVRLSDEYSRTTQRHVNDFLRKYGFSSLQGKKNFYSLPLNEARYID